MKDMKVLLIFSALSCCPDVEGFRAEFEETEQREMEKRMGLMGILVRCLIFAYCLFCEMGEQDLSLTEVYILPLQLETRNSNTLVLTGKAFDLQRVKRLFAFKCVHSTWYKYLVRDYVTVLQVYKAPS